MSNNYQKAALFFLFGLFIFIVALSFFKSPILIWDEALYANNALEMSRSGEPLLLTLDNQPSLYNTKPPVGIWLMALSIRIFGENEIAVRLPSVLAFLGVLIILVRFSRKHLGSSIIGVFAGLVLLGSKGLLLNHGVRTGDLDSLLLLCTTALVLEVYNLLYPAPGDKFTSKKRLTLIFLILLAGYFVKSTAVLLFLPGLAICILLARGAGSLARDRYFYLLTLAFFAIIAGYYILMDSLHPGYWRQVFYSEYQRAYTDIMPWHRKPAGWYLANMFDWRFTPFIYLLLPCAVICFLSRERNTRIFALFAAVNVLVYLILVSVVPDKLEWYDLPVYPFLALLIGMGFWEGTRYLSRRFDNKFFVPMSAIVLILLSIPAILLGKTLSTGDISHEFEKESYTFREVITAFPHLKKLTVLMETEDSLHRLSLDFYRKKYDDVLNTRSVPFISQLSRGDTVIVSQQDKMDSLAMMKIDTIYTFKYGKLIAIQ